MVVCPSKVGYHSSTNGARHKVTSLMRPILLSVSHRHQASILNAVNLSASFFPAVCKIFFKKTCEMIFIKFEETVCVGTVNNRLDFQAFCSNLTSGLKAHSHRARLRRYRTHGKGPARSTPSAFTSVDGRKRAQNRARFDFERVYVRRRRSTRLV